MSYFVKLENKITDEVHFEGRAEIQDLKNGIQVKFEDSAYAYHWNLYETGLVIRNHSEIDVVLTLKENRRTSGHIESEYGEIPLQCETLKYDWNSECVEVQYDLIHQDERQHFHFILYIYKEDEYGIH